MGSYSSPRELAACLLYATNLLDDENQLAAVEHRQYVTRVWGIPRGASVLEIGPGQGDFTVVLADAVGPTGRVVAVDNAPLQWGSPDYASSQAHVVASAVGAQVTFVQGDPAAFLEGNAGRGSISTSHAPFDFIVFGYCIWYFSDPAILANLLDKALPHARAVLVAEYSLSASLPAQVPHVLTALAENALESFRGEESKRNVRCARGPREITALAVARGWTLAAEEVATPGSLQIEGRREVRMVVKPLLKPGLFRRDLDSIVARVDPKIGHMLRTMVDAAAASVERLEGGLEAVRNMDVWIARFEKESVS